MTALYEATKQALAFTMRDFSTVRDFEAAKAVLQDTIRSALVEEEKAVAWLAERKEHWRKEKEKIQATDPELSAALGWPGGISNPVLDRKVLLQMVATMRLASQQALEVLKFCTPKPRPTDDDYAEQGWKEHNAAITALRAALVQQVEPDVYGYASRLAVAIWEKHYKDIAPQWKPLDDLMGVLTQIDNLTSGLTRLAQQAEPAQDSGFWGRVAARQASRIKQLETTAQQALEFFDAEFGWSPGEAPRIDALRAALAALRAAPAQQAEPVEMHPSQFAELIKGKEAMIGVPVYWSEWPTKEKQ